MPRFGNYILGDYDNQTQYEREVRNNMISFGAGMAVGLGIVAIGLIPFVNKIEGTWTLYLSW